MAVPYASGLEAELLAALAVSPMARARLDLGGSHTVVTYPPLDALEPLPGPEPFELYAPAGPVNYYLHIAFCEFICGFCHYTKTLHQAGRPSTQIDDYLSALEDEAGMRSHSLGPVRAGTVYVGGGTPTALEPARLERVLKLVARLTHGACEISVETSPLTVCAEDGAEKLQMLRAHGVGRLSLGVQTFDDDLLPRLRGHGRSTVIEAMTRLQDGGATLNIDLIQDLPGQTRGSLEQDILWISRFRPQQVTWYILRFHAESSMGRNPRRAASSDLPGAVESALRRAYIIQAMTQLGYSVQPGCRFTLDRRPDIHKTIRGGVDAHLLGLGASAYSHGWGWFFRNETSHRARLGIASYISQIASGRPATRWASPMTEAERRAGRLCAAIRTLAPHHLLQGDESGAACARVVLARLEEARFAVQAEDGWRLTDLGRLFEEEVASLFYSPAVRARLTAANAYWADDSWFSASRSGTDLPCLPAIAAQARSGHRR